LIRLSGEQVRASTSLAIHAIHELHRGFSSRFQKPAKQHRHR
jgi:hypothetical protein